MKFLVLSDIHGDVESIEKIEEQFKSVDAVLYAGDFADAGDESTGLPVLEKLCRKHDVIFSVLGNCDNPEFKAELEDRDVSVEKTLVMHDGLAFIGCGGGTKFTGTSPNERDEEDILDDFKIVTEQGNEKWDNLVVIMHNPPKDSDCDKIPGDIHVGSALLREFIEKYEPLFVATGHIHESFGVCRIGNSVVMNPGALLEGRYGLAEISKVDGKWQVTKTSLETC